MDTVRVARDLGDMSLLLPDGVGDLYDLPYNIWNSVRHALGFLGFDELDKDERPPRSIWLDGREMRKHWRQVEATRKVKFGGKADRYADEGIEGDVEENAAMKDLYA